MLQYTLLTLFGKVINVPFVFVMCTFTIEVDTVYENIHFQVTFVHRKIIKLMRMFIFVTLMHISKRVQ